MKKEKHKSFIFFVFFIWLQAAVREGRVSAEKPKPKEAARGKLCYRLSLLLGFTILWVHLSLLVCVCRCVCVLLPPTWTHVSSSWNLLPHLSGEFDQCGHHMARLMINVYPGRSTPTRLSRHTGRCNLSRYRSTCPGTETRLLGADT